MKALFFLITILPSLLCAQVLHDESIDGDLSNTVSSPTPFTLSEGSNIIRGSIGPDFDLLTITVPEGFLLVDYVINDYTTTPSNAISVIIAFPGPILPDTIENLSDRNRPGNEINNQAFSTFSIGERGELAGLLRTGDYFPGRTVLTSGDYAFWINETSQPSTYEIDFILEPAPPTYPEWIATFLSEPDLSNPALSSPEGDADGDGVPNLIDFASLNNPLSPDPELRPFITFPPTSPRPRFIYRRTRGGVGLEDNIYELGDTTYRIEISDSLESSSWLSDPADIDRTGQIIDNGDGTETVTIQTRSGSPFRDFDRVFFRLRVEQ